MNPEKKLKLQEKVQKYRSNWISRKKEKERDRAYHQQKRTNKRKWQNETDIDSLNIDSEEPKGLKTVIILTLTKIREKHS